MVETVVILFSACLLLFGIIQFGLIYQAKITLNYAAFEAARAGAVNYADRRAMEYALARGLAPLYTSVSEADSARDRVAKVQSARDRVLDEITNNNTPFACIERLNPPTSAFGPAAYGINDPLGRFSERIIPNDHLLYRSSTPRGGQISIQDANLLKIRVTYCYPMYVPFIATVIKRLQGVEPDPDPIDGWVAPALGSFREACLRADRIPLVAQAAVRMQTPARNDDFPSSCD